MSYCQPGEKPQVFYKFADTKERIYRASVAPIDVELQPYGAYFLGGQCPVRYQVEAYTIFSLGHYETQDLHRVKAYYSGIAIGPIRENPTKYPSDPFGGFFYAQQKYGVLGKDETSENQIYLLDYVQHEPPNIFASQYSWNYRVEGRITSVQRLDNLPDDCGDFIEGVQIIVSYEGNTIFSDSGKAPGRFTVACEDCPPGTVRCECSEYPGYCCLPCPPIISEIKSIKNLVKKLQ